MVLALVLGFFAGLGMILYKGLYFGPWNAALNTMGACLAASVVVYVLLHIVFSVGSFFIRLLLIIVIGSAILFGSQKLWNTFNPDKPLNWPLPVSSQRR